MSIPPFAVGVFWLALILGITAGFAVLARQLRNRQGGDGAPTASQLLAEFRELHEAGELSDSEYRSIRTKLAPQLQAEADASAVGGTMAESAAGLRAAAEMLSGGWGVESEGSGPGEGSDQRDETVPGGGANRDGCDAAPPHGGDSTGGSR